LSGGVAHDFNNVLAAILGRVQLLEMQCRHLFKKQENRKSILALKAGLEVIERATTDGAETVRRIQEFSRRRSDDKEYLPVDTNELIDNALEFTRMRWKDKAESKGIKYHIEKEFSSLPPVTGRSSELREVFTNLINNALDVMPEGGRIKIKTFTDNNLCIIKIEDTGIGIPKDKANRIFDPFFTTKGPQSTGLGLSVSYGIINRHRGTIKVDSIEGQGTIFTIQLPFANKICKQPISKEKCTPKPQKQRKARILIIDDEADVCELLRDILTDGGHEVETASDGSTGIKLFKEKEFDLVFTDLGMPGISGWQVAEKIKSINKSVPVTLITGWNVDLKQSEIKENGVDLIAYKPFEVKQVFKLVQEGMILKDRFKAA
jgi:CheY-like chemotaxis protein